MASQVHQVVQAALVLLDLKEILVLTAFPVRLDLWGILEIQALLDHQVVSVLLVRPARQEW